MAEFNKVEDTLFVPMLGRIWCSNHFPEILYDKKALELGKIIPPDLMAHAKGNEYTKIASAVRSTNMDRYLDVQQIRCYQSCILQVAAPPDPRI